MKRAAALVFLALGLVFPSASSARESFVPTDPLVKYQYYLEQDHAFDAFGDTLPKLNPVNVAIIDSGLDITHPEFPKKLVWAAKSFVNTPWSVDEQGHGTFVAGEIAAAIDNGKGIAGIAFPAQLIIAKIASADGSISVDAEAAAIRWSVDHGAQVINLSLGGVRDPLDPHDDTYSPEEASALQYAVRHNVVIVAAVGNSDEAPRSPWPWASYPAALPHVIGVSALTESGNVASFSNRDAIYNDISAPGEDIFSTLPLALTKQNPTCVDQGYSDCGPSDFRPADGTSFAAPQVAAAAALLLALRPTLRADQVSNILERSATDVNSADGCLKCPRGRDAFTGWGRLDISKAVAALGEPLPPADHFEPNDNAGSLAPVLPPARRILKATLDYWDDPIDVYRFHLATGHSVSFALKGPAGTTSKLVLWKPGTRSVMDLRHSNMKVAQTTGRGSLHRLSFRAQVPGWYYIEAKLVTRGFGQYTLSIKRT